MEAMESKYSVFDIATWFIWKGKTDEVEHDAEPITLLKLMKLLYYAEGYSLASGNGSLFSDKFEGWEHGPAIRCVWERYHECAKNLPYEESRDFPIVESISERDTTLLYAVYDAFGIYTAWGLRTLTHSEDPWKDATNNGRILNQEIKREAIVAYFKEHYV